MLPIRPASTAARLKLDRPMAPLVKLHRYADQIARKLQKGKPPAPTEQMVVYLDNHLEEVFDSLDGFIQQLDRERPEADALAYAYLFLLGLQLEYLRYRIDRDYDWAKQLLERFQDRLVARVRQGKLSREALSLVTAALREAKIRPSSDLVAVTEEAMGVEEPADVASGEIDSLLQEIATQCADDIFEICNSLAEAAYAMPIELRSFLAAQMAQYPSPVIREAAALMVLDADEPVRRDVALSLAQRAELLTPTGLRRLIAIRNWLPEDERQLIDRAVREARRKGIDCAPWNPVGSVEIHSSGIDGSGAQGFLIVSPEGRRRRLSSLLLKQAVGVIDAWTGDTTSKRDIARTLEDAGAMTSMMLVSRGYLDRAVCHHLHVGLTTGAVPPAGVLQVAEIVGATEWRPAELDLRETLRELTEDLPEELRTAAGVNVVLQTSALWATIGEIADSWFEDDQEVEDLLHGSRTRHTERLARRVLAEIVENRRRKWAEQFVWLALWLKEGPQPRRLPWQQFAILAREISDGRPLDEIPLMWDIALRTVDVLGP
jgi:hypothetical protein